MDKYEQYQQACDAIRKDNKDLLAEFEKALAASGLTRQTIGKHVGNMDFFLNEYLIYEELVEARDGIDRVDGFLGYWFIRKAMWASPTSIRENATSLKKFYAFMLDKGLIEAEDLAGLKKTIKEYMPEWQETMHRYDNISIDNDW